MTATPLSGQQKIFIESSRVVLFLVILSIAVISFLLQPRFINWSVLGSIYLGVGVSLGLHLFYVLNLESFYNKTRWLFSSFLLDSLLISTLIYASQQNQSLFLFLHLANIIVSGLLFRSRGALIVALFTGLSFSFVSLISLDLKGLNYVFLLILNNVAFFSVAGLSGFLSDQLHLVGRELAETGLKLKDLTELNEAIISNSPVGIITFNKDGEILQRNVEMKRIFSFNEDVNFIQWVGGMDLPQRQEISRLHIVTPDSKEYQILIKRLSDAGEGYYFALVEDRTEMRRMEEELRQNEKLAAIGRLAAGIAHEIRNPLAGISGSVEMLSQTSQDPDDKKLMQIVLRETDRLNNLISEFLDYSRPEKMPTEEINLSTLLRDVIEVTSKNKEYAGKIHHDVQISENLRVKAHADKLRQAFINILVNAYQAMTETSEPQLKVRTIVTGDVIEIQITDNGCGMGPETVQRIFEPFFTTKAKGTGLGLALTHKIFETHRAQVVVESEKGKGSVFSIRFPLSTGK